MTCSVNCSASVGVDVGGGEGPPCRGRHSEQRDGGSIGPGVHRGLSGDYCRTLLGRVRSVAIGSGVLMSKGREGGSVEVSASFTMQRTVLGERWGSSADLG